MYKDLLFSLDFNVGSIGFKYWLKAIEIYKKDHDRYGFTLQYLYYEIAQFYNTTSTRVERALRTSSEKAKSKIQNSYNYYGKITNKIILELITNY